MATTIIKCIDDAAYEEQATKQAASIVTEGRVWGAIQIALMIAQRQSNGAITDMQEGIASRRMALGEEVLVHAQKTWVKEKEFVDEVMAAPKFEVNYGNAQITLNEVDRVEDLAVEGIDNRLSRMGIEVGACDDSRTRRLMANVRTDLVSHSMRSAEGRTLALNDVRYSRQVAAVALGRNILQQSLSMGKLSGGQEVVRNSLLNTINSANTLWGYSANRWRHGGNFHTGETGAPTMVRPGYAMVETISPNTGTITVSMQRENFARESLGADDNRNGEN